MAAVLVVAFACAAPPKTVANLESPTPSPSPTPTAPLQASAPGFHVGEVGVGYSPVALSAGGGVEPYKWTISAGALPPGLVLGTDGSVSGNPTSAGSYAFTIQVADSGDSTTTINGTIGVAPPVTASLLPACAQYCNVELGCVTVCGVFGTLGGGVAPYSYAVTQGPLPAGTSLSTLSLTGTFVGQPGYLQFTVQVTDALGVTTSISPTFWMYRHISLSGTVVCNGNYLTPCTASIPYSGGIPGSTATASVVAVGGYCPPNFTFCPPAPSGPPGGFTAVADNGAVSVTVPARCAGGCPNGYYGAITLQLTDSDKCSAGTYCVSGTAVVDVYIQAG